MTGSRNDVLVVVDDPAERDSVVDSLAARGYHVQATSAFSEAKAELCDHPPRVLVSDVRLGAFNGLYLALIAQDVPVDGVVLLDLAFAASLEVQARQMGAVYAVKPVADLTSLVGRALKSAETSPLEPSV